MKVEQTDLPMPTPPYVPQRITIDLETREEGVAFFHILACWSDPQDCGDKHAAGILAWQLFCLTRLPT